MLKVPVFPILTMHLSHSTIYSHIGDVKTISGQFKRSDLCSEHHLNVSGLASSQRHIYFSAQDCSTTISLGTFEKLIQGFLTWYLLSFRERKLSW